MITRVRFSKSLKMMINYFIRLSKHIIMTCDTEFLKKPRKRMKILK